MIDSIIFIETGDAITIRDYEQAPAIKASAGGGILNVRDGTSNTMTLPPQLEQQGALDGAGGDVAIETIKLETEGWEFG